MPEVRARRSNCSIRSPVEPRKYQMLAPRVSGTSLAIDRRTGIMGLNLKYFNHFHPQVAK